MNTLIDEWKLSVDKCIYCKLFLCPTHWWQMMLIYYITVKETDYD